MSRDLHCDRVRSWLLSGTWYDTVDSLWFAAKRIIYYGYIPTVIYLGLCDPLSMHARRHSNRSPRLAWPPVWWLAVQLRLARLPVMTTAAVVAVTAWPSMSRTVADT
jgi:hypothetical protein